MDPLRLAGRHAKWVLAAGLVAAVAMPGVSTWLSDILVPLILAIMFLGALRLRPAEVSAIWRAPGRSLVQVLALQLLLPLLLAGAVLTLGLGQHPAALVIVLLMAAPSILSSPNMAAIMGLDGATAMRLVIWGTALVPLTCLPVLALIFDDLPFWEILRAAARLAAIIALAGGAGFVLRRLWDARITPAMTERLDGASALGLSVFVMALMPALRSSAMEAPVALAGWIALAFAINIGPQLVSWFWFQGRRDPGVVGSQSIVAGNRNLALFFAALPAADMAVFLPFLAAYQFPMYLTPILMGRLYGRK